MTEFLTKPFTYQDYLQLPDDGNRYEIIEGELFVTPGPLNFHQFTSSELFFAIKQFVNEHHLGWVFHPPFEVHLSEKTRPVQPDIVFIRKGNKPKGYLNYFDGVPNLVVEILSKSTAKVDLGTKLLAYEKAGIPEYWTVDPKTHSVRVYTLEEGSYVIHGEYVKDEVIESKELAGFSVVNSKLFDEDE